MSKSYEDILKISIHALREEGDALPICWKKARRSISIHALREEGDYWLTCGDTACNTFLSTPSARRAT